MFFLFKIFYCRQPFCFPFLQSFFFSFFLCLCNLPGSNIPNTITFFYFCIKNATISFFGVALTSPVLAGAFSKSTDTCVYPFEFMGVIHLYRQIIRRNFCI